MHLHANISFVDQLKKSLGTLKSKYATVVVSTGSPFTNCGRKADKERETVENLDRKLFIGGLSWKTTEEGVKEHFSKYGDLEDVQIMREPQSQVNIIFFS